MTEHLFWMIYWAGFFIAFGIFMTDFLGAWIGQGEFGKGRDVQVFLTAVFPSALFAANWWFFVLCVVGAALFGARTAGRKSRPLSSKARPSEAAPSGVATGSEGEAEAPGGTQ